MKNLMMVLILVVTSRAIAKDHWFCTDESSQVFSNEIHACGVAVSLTEGEARSIALDNAFEEFSVICKHSESCKDRKYDLIPTRTECEQLRAGNYKCWRMARFILH